MKKLKRFFTRKEEAAEGQSLVEMAFITPILIFMLLGVFEVGWALRGYLVLVNANREVTRYTVRQNYLNFYERDCPDTGSDVVCTPVEGSVAFGGTGYARSSDLTDPGRGVREHLLATVGNSLDMSGRSEVGGANLEEKLANGSAILNVSHFVAHTGYPCGDTAAEIAACDCESFVKSATDTTPYKEFYLDHPDNFTYDDLILHPGYSYYAYYTYTTALTRTLPKSVIRDYEEFVYKRALNNNKFNCERLKSGLDSAGNFRSSVLPSNDNVIVTELYFEQPQIFGFPLLSVGPDNPLGVPITDPVFMYTQTTMRLLASARDTMNEQAVGPVCNALPIAGSVALANTVPQFDSEGTPIGTSVESSPGVQANLFAGWLAWGTPDGSPIDYLKMQLKYPVMAINEYEDGTNLLDARGSDTVDSLSVGLGGPNLDDVNELLAQYINSDVIIPLLSGNTMTGAAVVRLTQAEANVGGNVTLNGFLLRRANEECLDTNYPPPTP